MSNDKTLNKPLADSLETCFLLDLLVHTITTNNSIIMTIAITTPPIIPPITAVGSPPDDDPLALDWGVSDNK